MKKFIRIFLIIISCLALIGICVYNAIYVNPYQLKTRTVTIKSDKFTNDLDGLSIAYFSDIYFDSGLDRTYFDRTIKRVSDMNADIVIFGGDLSNHLLNEEDKEYVTNSLKSINAKLGKYYVLGEYDFDYKDEVNDILTNANFKLLENDFKRVYLNNDYFYLVGLDSNDLDTTCLSSVDSDHYSIVVAHYPDTFDRINDLSFDYMLAGHTLGGPVYIPIIDFFNRPVGGQKYFKGKTSSDGKVLDITNGSGLRVKNSARFLADAEIVLYKLESTN